MTNRAILVGGLALAGTGIFLLTRKAKAAGECYDLQASTWYHATWLGANKPLPAAFGTAWSFVYSVEFYEQDEQTWYPPADPSNYVILHAEHCRFMLVEGAQVCGFRIDYPPTPQA